MPSDLVQIARRKLNSKTLSAGYQIHNYRIEEVLGEGGFGITYKAIDLNLNRLVAIKEYMPDGIAVRSENGDVEPKNVDCEKLYQDGLMSYVREAQALARFEHDNIVKVYTFLRHHKTAYIIMEYVDGMTFSKWLRMNPSPTEEQLVAIVSPLLIGLHELHKVELLHRDIKPSNIYICSDNRPILLDFGAVGDSLPSDLTKNLSVVKLTEGYAPPEQYGNSGHGPWTDIYSVGACLYLAVTGQLVTNAMERTTQVFNGNADPQPSLQSVALRNDYSKSFLCALEKAISLNPKDRVEDALKLRNSLKNIGPSDAVHESSNVQLVIQGGDGNNQEGVGDDQKFIATKVSPKRVVPFSGELTITKNSAAHADFIAHSESTMTDKKRSAHVTLEADSEPKHSGAGKLKVAMGAAVGVLLMIWGMKFIVIAEPVKDAVVEDFKVRIDQKIGMIEAMKMPKSGNYQDAMSTRQLAIDIESEKVEGDSDAIRSNYEKTDSYLKAHILTIGSAQITQLLVTVNGKIEEIDKLAVQDSVIPDLAEFTNDLSDVESVRNQFDGLSVVAKQLDDDLRKKARKYVIGSTEKDIEDALEICKQYSSECTREWYADELARAVILSPFELDKSEVTLGEFKFYAVDQKIETLAQTRGFSYTVDRSRSFAVTRSDNVYWKNGYGIDVEADDQPVLHLARADAEGYCNYMGKRLPTEAEWEYVARGSSGFKFPWGDNWDATRVNWGAVGHKMLPVNSFQANDRGYFDLAGGVTEWTSTISIEEDIGVLKGGSRFDKNVANFRLPVRRLENVEYTGEDVGFRCAKSTDEWPGEQVK